MIYTGTTPTYVLTFQGVDFTQADEIVVTISDMNEVKILELTPEATETTLSFSLTQEQTLAMPIGSCLIQVNWLYDGGNKRAASNKAKIDFRKNLKHEVME